MQPDVLNVNNITQSTFACLRRRHSSGHRFAIETWEQHTSLILVQFKSKERVITESSDRRKHHCYFTEQN